MATVYVGSLMLVPYNFPPLGYAFCNGQLMNISQNTALFSLLGTTFGGDGKTTFGLPNLQGRHAIGQGAAPGLQTYNMGEVGGTTTVTLTGSTVPQHNHSVLAGKLAADKNTPSGNVLGLNQNPQIYSDKTTNMVPMNNGSTNVVGNNAPHQNMMPYQGLQWIIALQGIFPPRG